MTETPEWFELTKHDERPSSKEPKKSKKRFLRVLAFALPLVIVGGTMVMAESGGEAEDLQPTAVAQTTLDATDQNSNVNSNIKVASVANPAAPAKQGVAIPKPQGGEHERHEDREGHESGEHQGGDHEGGEDDD